VFYVIYWANNFLAKVDIEGNAIGQWNLNRQVTSIASSPELGVFIVGDNNNDRNIYVYQGEGQDAIATIPRGNWQQHVQGQWQRSLLWVDKHPEGQLWMNTSNHIWQLAINMDNWQITGVVNHWNAGANQGQEWDGLGHDGDNIIYGKYGGTDYWIFDDGTEELYWIRWDPKLGEVAADADVDVVVTLNATDLIGGAYEGNIHFLSNDPAHWDVPVNVLVNVSGAPVVETDPIAEPMADAPEQLEFETTYVGGVSAIAVTIANIGTEQLNIDRITSTNGAEFNTDADGGLDIAAREEAVVNLLFHPTDIGDREGRVTFFSDAVNVGAGDEAGQFWFDLVGVGQTPPDIATVPDYDGWIRVGLPLDEDPVDRDLVIGNEAGEGGDDLDWEIIVEEIEMERDAGNRSLRSVHGEAVGPRRDPPESRYALFKNGGGWNDAMEQMWGQEGVEIQQYNSNQFGNAPIEDYECIWIREYQDDGFNNAWNQNRARFEEWVDAGGVLYHGTSTNNWGVAPVNVGGITRNAQNYSNRGIVEITNNPEADNYSYFAELTGWRGGEELPGNSWCHSSYNRGALGDIDNSDWFQVIARFSENQNLAGAVVYSYGRGYSIITGTTDSHQYGQWRQQGMWGWALNKLIWYMDDLANQLPSWLDIDLMEGSIARGEETVVTLTFNSEDLEADTEYRADLMIESNDPDQPTTVIHLLLRTGSIGPEHFTGVEETDANHSLLVTGVSFDREPVPAGWEVGVFTPGGVLAGAGVWEGDDLGIAVWGADDNHPDYFENGETMNLLVWDNSADGEWPGAARVEDGDMIWQGNGFTALAIEAFSARTMQVPFRSGWNLISINVTPTDQALYAGDPGPEIIPMMAQLARPNDENGNPRPHHVILMKNERGAFYVPARRFNNIAYWNLTEGYQVRTDSAMSGRWTGMPISPQADVPISRGWNMIAFFPDYQLDASARGGLYVISPIRDNVVIAKDGLGNFMIPARNFSNMQPWREGLGYQINVNQEVVLNYPMARNQAASLAIDPQGSVEGRWADIPSTGANMSLLISRISGVELSAVDQVAAFSPSGRLVGLGSVTQGQVGIAVWGDDNSTDEVDGLRENEAFTLKLWDANQDVVVDLGMTSRLEGKGLVYETDGFTVIDAAVQVALPTEYYLGQNYPNPFNAVTRVAFGLPEASRVTIRVFDVAGREASTLVNGELKAGHHNVVWSAESLVSGVYIVKMETSNFSAVRKVMLVK